MSSETKQILTTDGIRSNHEKDLAFFQYLNNKSLTKEGLDAAFKNLSVLMSAMDADQNDNFQHLDLISSKLDEFILEGLEFSPQRLLLGHALSCLRWVMSKILTGMLS